MAARAFACILAEDSGQLTAAELAERLEVSPAAISGAVRYLTQVGMLVRGREPGARRDHFRLHDDVWAEMYTSRLVVLRHWEEALAEGVELLGTDSPAGRRLDESREFLRLHPGGSGGYRGALAGAARRAGGARLVRGVGRSVFSDLALGVRRVSRA
jgi:predicted transcriptional regulator